MSDDLTPRMLWYAAQREGDKGTDGSDLTFTRLLQILAAIEVAEAARELCEAKTQEVAASDPLDGEQ